MADMWCGVICFLDTFSLSLAQLNARGICSIFVRITPNYLFDLQIVEINTLIDFQI